MLAFHRTGIDLATVQLIRKAVLLGGIVAGITLMVISESRWPGDTTTHEAIEWVGLVLIVVCILGRTWCSLYIGAHKVRSLVTHGPYSVTRNPLYLFSVLGAAGAGAQLGSIALSVTAGAIAWLVFHVVVRKEERVLALTFGNTFRHYVALVPRFLPNPSLWHDVEKIEVRPTIVRRTFVDACLFLLSIPLAEGFEYLHDAGLLAVVMRLP